MNRFLTWHRRQKHGNCRKRNDGTIDYVLEGRRPEPAHPVPGATGRGSQVVAGWRGVVSTRGSATRQVLATFGLHRGTITFRSTEQYELYSPKVNRLLNIW